MDHDVLVVGAGSAGLTISYELLKRGIDLQIIDEAESVGSSWRRRHQQLHLNTYRGFSSLPGTPIPRQYGQHIKRDHFIGYLEDYATALGQSIQFDTCARQIRRHPDGRWLVETGQDEIRAAHVIVATGPEREPFIPDWPGRDSFQGELVHSADFRHAEDYIDKRVLLIGASNSAVDIGNHLARVPIEDSWMSVRTGPTIVPQYLFGLSAHIPFMALKWLPIKGQDFVVAMLSRLFLGDLTQYGFPPPPVGAVTRDIQDGVTMGIDNGFINAVKDGRFTIVPEVSSFTAHDIHLIDGRTISPDAVICATGYRPGLETLVGDLDVLNDQGRPRFYAAQRSDDHPGLWFFGMNTSIYGYIYTRKKEAVRLAEKITRSL